MEKCQLHQFFQTWLNQQEADLQNLLQALEQHAGDENKLCHIVKTNIQHMQEYHEKRSFHFINDAASFFSPPWSSPFENSFFWIAGYRPSLVICLVYTLSSSEGGSELGELLKRMKKSSLSELSAEKLACVKELHGRVSKEEEEITSVMEKFQEDVGDGPLVCGLDELITDKEAAFERVFKAQTIALKGILDKADKLRLDTLKELVNILSPLQAVDFLVATNKLHLSMREWGRTRDGQLEASKTKEK